MASVQANEQIQLQLGHRPKLNPEPEIAFGRVLFTHRAQGGASGLGTCLESCLCLANGPRIARGSRGKDVPAQAQLLGPAGPKSFAESFFWESLPSSVAVEFRAGDALGIVGPEPQALCHSIPVPWPRGVQSAQELHAASCVSGEETPLCSHLQHEQRHILPSGGSARRCPDASQPQRSLQGIGQCQEQGTLGLDQGAQLALHQQQRTGGQLRHDLPLHHVREK